MPHSPEVLLRRFVPADAEFAVGLHSNPDLARFIPSAVLHTTDDAMTWFDRIERNATTPARGWWCVTRADGVPAGTVMLKTIPTSVGHEAVAEDGDIEIGWRVHADHTGHGYATAAARQLLDRGFTEDLDRVVAVVKSENLASQAVCRRLGMTHRGITDRYYDEPLELFDISPNGWVSSPRRPERCPSSAARRPW